jgi:hypothetical protein
MAWTGIYVPTMAEFQYKCGAKCSATSKAEAYGNNFVFQAESTINALCRKVFATSSATFTALPSTTRGILTEAASNLAAIYAITYAMTSDTSGATFPSRGEAEDMIVVLRDGFLRNISILRDKKMQGFLMTGVEN